MDNGSRYCTVHNSAVLKRKPGKHSGFNGIQTHDPAILLQHSFFEVLMVV